MIPRSKAKPLADRLWEKVDVRGFDECWPWLGGTAGKGGYGKIVELLPEGKRRNAFAHRVMYTLIYGDIPQGMVVRHLCGNSACVNYHHLDVGTQAQNSQDAVRHGTAKIARARGEGSYQSKLTWEDVLNIRLAEKSDREYAEMYQVSASTVHSARIGKTWKYGVGHDYRMEGWSHE